MRYRTLGSTGMQVSTYCLGTMTFGPTGNPDHDECARIVDAAIDAGINFIDTADIYSVGESERIVGNALRGKRDNIILATKLFAPMGPDPNERGNSRRWIIREVENSLRRLETDWIDLYQVHRSDPKTDIEETLSALSDLIHQGKVRAIGCSTFPAEKIVEAHWAAERRGLERFRTEQPPYSIFTRGIERAVLPTVERYGMGAIVWSPLAGGWLTDKYRNPGEIDLTVGRASGRPSHYDPTIPGNQRKVELIGHLGDIADGAGISLTQMALAFTVTHPAVTSAIIGLRTLTQLEDLLKGVDVVLSDETLDAIDALVPPGTNLSEEEAGWSPAALLSDPGARRRAVSERAAG
ncbi:MAG TPA: aldo/keto reductase [Acidimicrobiales bacterium]|nr:aldo/keto reductase [Acidimicrobiales bacterium]